jgi:hypothetical protein
VTAVAPTGSSPHPVPMGPDNCFPFDPSESTAFTTELGDRFNASSLALTPPMADVGGIGVPAGTNSTASAPAKGRARYDFELADRTIFAVAANVNAPNTSQDSFWVRFDSGAWINWNNIKSGCAEVRDSGKSGSPLVGFDGGAGSHTIEWAYREGGARLDGNIAVGVISVDEKGIQHAMSCDD